MQCGPWAPFVCVVACGALLGGCVTRRGEASYPEAWAPPAAVAATECPRLAGKYVNAGQMAPGTPQDLCAGGRHRFRGEWRCEATLSRNLAELSAGEWVELRQPDADTVVVISSDPAVDVRELHRSRGDFSCSAQGLERELHASTMSVGDDSPSTAGQAAFNGVGTSYGLLFGSGGVRTLTRSFRPAADGALVMSVTRSEAGAMLLIPFHFRSDTFVRWERWVAPAAAPGATPAAADGAAPGATGGDAPSARVARFESINGEFGRYARVLGVDGQDGPDRLPNGDTAPLVLEPGRHWLEIGRHGVHWVPLRDVETTYGFELEAAAGHVYRLDGRPPACVAPGDVDAALASHRVYHRAVAVLDEVAGQEVRRFEAEALCTSGAAIRCPLPAEYAAADDGQACITLGASGRGYYGRDADAR